MKKLAIMACIMTVSAGVAMAQQTVAIPFFSDDGATTAFITLQNTGGVNTVVNVEYRSIAGAIESGGTALLAPGESVSYRPAADIGAGEVQAGLADATFPYGSVKFGSSASTVAGRFVQFGPGGAFAHNTEVN